jgi:hypothetical protein
MNEAPNIRHPTSKISRARKPLSILFKKLVFFKIKPPDSKITSLLYRFFLNITTAFPLKFSFKSAHQTNNNNSRQIKKSAKEQSIMPKKITRLNKAKIYRPAGVSPLFATNIITNNKTRTDGNVENISEINASAARDWVNENEK